MYHRAVLFGPASDEPGEASSPESTTQSSQVLKLRINLLETTRPMVTRHVKETRWNGKREC